MEEENTGEEEEEKEGEDEKEREGERTKRKWENGTGEETREGRGTGGRRTPTPTTQRHRCPGNVDAKGLASGSITRFKREEKKTTPSGPEAKCANFSWSFSFFFVFLWSFYHSLFFPYVRPTKTIQTTSNLPAYNAKKTNAFWDQF